MNNLRKTLVITLIFLMLSAMIVPLIKAETLTSDKLTYYIGQDNQAILTGTEFEPGSNVTIQVTIAEDPTYLFNSNVILVGDDGTFTYTYLLPGIEGNYTAAALDEAGNVLATTTFIDPAVVGTVTVSTQYPNPVPAGNSAVYTVTVTKTGGTGAMNNVDLSITTTLPTGASYSFSPSSLDFGPGVNSLTSTLTISTTTSTPPDTYPFSVQADKSGDTPVSGSGSLIVSPGFIILGTDDATRYNDASHIEDLGTVTQGTDLINDIYVTGSASVNWQLSLDGVYQDGDALSLTTVPGLGTFSTNGEQTTVVLTIHTSSLTAGTTYTARLVGDGHYGVSGPIYAQYYFQFTVEASVVSTVTEKVTITPAGGYTSSDSVTVSGAGASVTSIPMDGVEHTFTADASSTITFTVPADGTNSRYRFNDGGVASTTWSYTTGTAGSTDTKSNTVYYQLSNTYSVTINYGNPLTGDTIVLTGTYLGSAANILTLNVGGVSSASDSAWSDYGATVTFPATSTNSGSSERWAIDGAYTTSAINSGGNTYSQTYYHQFSVSFDYSTNDGTTINSYTDLVAYTQFGSTKHLSTGVTGTLSLSSDWADATTSVTYVSPVSISSTERYIIDLTDSGTNTVIASVGSIANSADPEYRHQYQVTFSQTGIDSDAGTNTVLTVGSTSYQWDNLPDGVWFDAGTTFSWMHVIPGGNGKQFVLFSQTGTSPIETAGTYSAVYHVNILAYTGDTSGQYSDPVTVSATFTDTTSDTPIVGQTIKFQIGTQIATATTNSLGVASTTIILTQPSGSYTVIASLFVLHPSLVPPLQTSTPFTIYKEDATIEYTGSSGLKTTDSFTPILSATVTQADDGYPGDLTLCRVEFDLYKSTDISSPASTYFAMCDASGNAVVASPPTLDADVWTIVVRIDPANGYFTENEADVAILSISISASGSANGGGWIHDDESLNGKGNFGFSVHYQMHGKKISSVQGSFVYVYRGLDGYTYVVKSNSWVGGGLAFTSETAASFSGKCVIQKIDSTGTVVASAGNSQFWVAVNDVDQGLPQSTGTDTIAISFSGSSSTLGSIDRAIPTTDISGGNINVRKV